MTDTEFFYFMALMMCSDPWPITARNNETDGQGVLLDLVEKEANLRGFDGWIEAFHQFSPNLGGR